MHKIYVIDNDRLSMMLYDENVNQSKNEHQNKSSHFSSSSFDEANVQINIDIVQSIDDNVVELVSCNEPVCSTFGIF
jgi:hypothetical protein